jgi:hypothetical protein
VVIAEVGRVRRLGFNRPLKELRKLGATLLASHEVYGRFHSYFLGHSPRTVADRHYVRPPQELFDEAVLWLGEQLGQNGRPLRGRRPAWAARALATSRAEGGTHFVRTFFVDEAGQPAYLDESFLILTRCRNPARGSPMPDNLPAAEGPPRTASPAVERRRWRRRACRPAPVLCYVPWPSEMGHLGLAVDIGPEGIGFRSEGPLRPGAVLALQVLCGARTASRTRVARVAYCAGGEEGRWRVGCAVSPPFGGEEIASLL